MSRARKTNLVKEGKPIDAAFAVFSTVTSSKMRYDVAKALAVQELTYVELQKQNDFPATSIYHVLQDFVDRGIAYQSRQGVNVFYSQTEATKFVLASIEELATDFKNEYFLKESEIQNADLPSQIKEGIIQTLHDGCFELSLEKALEAFYAGSETKRYEILKLVSEQELSFNKLHKAINKTIIIPPSSLSNIIASLRKASLVCGDAFKGYVLEPAGKYVLNAVDTLAGRLGANLIEEKMAILKKGNPTPEISEAYESFLKAQYEII